MAFNKIGESSNHLLKPSKKAFFAHHKVMEPFSLKFLKYEFFNYALLLSILFIYILCTTYVTRIRDF